MATNNLNQSNGSGMMIPLTEKDITPEWITRVTGLKPVADTISITANIQDGVGFLSNLCRVSFQTGTETTTNQNLLVKLLPASPEFRALTISEKFDEREIKFYSIAVPQILSVAPDLGNYLCKYFCGSIHHGKEESGEDHASMLIMEDLKPLGYQMMDPEGERWKENLESVCAFLGKFHSTWLPLEKATNKKIAELLPFCMGIEDLDENNSKPPSTMLMDLAKVNLPRLESFLAERGFSEAMQTAYNDLSPYNDEIFAKIFKEGAAFPCLIHGDVWPPNVMIADKPELPVKIIDWQLLGFKDPCYEVTVAILTCLPLKEMTVENIDYFAKFYYKTFLQSVNEAGFGASEQVRSEKDFMEFFNTWGMGYAFLWLLLSFDSFPTGTDRLAKAFAILYEKYEVPQFLLGQCKNV